MSERAWIWLRVWTGSVGFVLHPLWAPALWLYERARLAQGWERRFTREPGLVSGDLKPPIRRVTGAGTQR